MKGHHTNQFFLYTLQEATRSCSEEPDALRLRTPLTPLDVFVFLLVKGILGYLLL
jgi:hypothetical protein